MQRPCQRAPPDLLAGSFPRHLLTIRLRQMQGRGRARIPPGAAAGRGTLAAHDEWVAAGCPGALSHEEAMAELLGSNR